MRPTLAITAALAAALALAGAGAAAPGLAAAQAASADNHQGCNITIVVGPVDVLGVLVGLGQQVVCIDTCELVVGTYNLVMNGSQQCPH